MMDIYITLILESPIEHSQNIINCQLNQITRRERMLYIELPYDYLLSRCHITREGGYIISFSHYLVVAILVMKEVDSNAPESTRTSMEVHIYQ